MIKWILIGLMSFINAQSTQTLPVVSVADVKQGDFQPLLSLPANIYAYNGADLALESSGVVTNIDVVSGQSVKQGDLLIQLDNTSEKATYDAALTAANNAEVEFNRQKDLYAQGIVSTETFETSQNQLAEALSNLVTAKVALDHRRLDAPYDGVVGMIQLSIGTYVSAGTSLLSLIDLNSMRVDFSFNQDFYTQIKPGQVIDINNSISQKSGQVSAISSVVDSASGQVSAQGKFDNASDPLPSGLLVNLSVHLPIVKDQITVPASALVYSLSGNYVYVVDDIKTEDNKTTGKVTQAIVTIGQIGKSDIVILSGLKAGQKVVSAGSVKINQSGVTVEIDTTTPLPS